MLLVIGGGVLGYDVLGQIKIQMAEKVRQLVKVAFVFGVAAGALLSSVSWLFWG